MYLGTSGTINYSIGAPPPPRRIIPERLCSSLGKEWRGEQRKRERGGREAEDGEEGAEAGAIPRDAPPHRTRLGAPPPPFVTVLGRPTPAPAAAAAAVSWGGDPSSFLLGGRQKSQAQHNRRCERNRILAPAQKFFFECLQKDVVDLQRENTALKSIARSRLRPDDATALLEGCDANDLR